MSTFMKFFSYNPKLRFNGVSSSEAHLIAARELLNELATRGTPPPPANPAQAHQGESGALGLGFGGIFAKLATKFIPKILPKLGKIGKLFGSHGKKIAEGADTAGNLFGGGGGSQRTVQQDATQFAQQPGFAQPPGLAPPGFAQANAAQLDPSQFNNLGGFSGPGGFGGPGPTPFNPGQNQFIPGFGKRGDSEDPLLARGGSGGELVGRKGDSDRQTRRRDLVDLLLSRGNDLVSRDKKRSARSLDELD